MRAISHVTLSIATALVTLGGCGSGTATGDTCPALSAQLVRDLASRTSTVVQGAVEHRASLTDGTTSTEGLLVRVDRTLAGVAAPQRIAIWSDLTMPSPEHLADGSTVVAFVNPHAAATTADGKPIPAYDYASANGLLTVADNNVRLQCRDSAGESTDASVLDHVGP
jgi:hypothetical protein